MLARVFLTSSVAVPVLQQRALAPALAPLDGVTDDGCRKADGGWRMANATYSMTNNG